MPSIKVNMTMEVSDQFLLDVMVTMVESGGYALWYWEGFSMIDIERDGDLNVTQIRFQCEHVATGCKADTIDGDMATYTIRSSDVKDAIETILTDPNHCNIADYIVEYIRRGVSDDDAGDIDAEAADVIAQIAAFGEVVFG